MNIESSPFDVFNYNSMNNIIVYMYVTDSTTYVTDVIQFILTER